MRGGRSQLFTVPILEKRESRESMLKSLVGILVLMPAILAAELKGNIFFNSVLTGPEALNPSTKVVLNHGQHQTLIRKDGSFIFPELAEGAYHLAVHSPDYAYSPLFISLSNTTTHAQYLSPGRLALPSTQTSSLSYPLQLVPNAKLEFYTEPRGLDILGMLKNPMVLMMLVSAGLMFVMPKMMASMAEMDPEAAKDVAQIQAKARSAMNTDWSGHLAGLVPSGGGGAETPSSGKSTPPVGATTKTTGGKKRKGK